ncbi:response regulator [Methylocapsa palsarum]|uniref:DNA-binding response regulator, NarL/FixJ family, contains REC and HTH domains n=1 Tax=Methylocapsa palsarum TaxID=1612308 RepID=A0A1I3XG65_9HYPH|nr:response regulator transcription factor [Methylocapsa palsarum]SFK18518.1 DNA-binding response regulator, NarL/FixJ family, contains REC and HTH domains [Methylocapsa palsarum]
MTSALIIDDHPIVLRACRKLLEDAGVAMIYDAADFLTGYRLFYKRRPDVTIIDLVISGSGLGGLDLIRRIRLRDLRARILVFSMHADPVIVGRALEAGANGYVVKDSDPDEFVAAFRKVRDGEPYLSHMLAMDVALVGARAKPNLLSQLSSREVQTLALLAEGKSYSSIASEMNVSYKTVVNVCSLLRSKLGVSSLAELIGVAVRHTGAF